MSRARRGGSLMDLIQFLDNAALAWPLTQDNLSDLYLWYKESILATSGDVVCLSDFNTFHFRLWRPWPAGPRTSHVRPLQPSCCRSEARVRQFGLAALQPAGPLPDIPHHVRRGRHAGRPSAHQRLQGVYVRVCGDCPPHYHNLPPYPATHLPPLWLASHVSHLQRRDFNISTFIVYISGVWLSSIQMGGMGGDTGLGFSHHHVNGGPRKYQCKMCPQVGIFSSLVSRLSLSL